MIGKPKGRLLLVMFIHKKLRECPTFALSSKIKKYKNTRIARKQNQTFSLDRSIYRFVRLCFAPSLWRNISSSHQIGHQVKKYHLMQTLYQMEPSLLSIHNCPKICYPQQILILDSGVHEPDKHIDSKLPICLNGMIQISCKYEKTKPTKSGKEQNISEI